VGRRKKLRRERVVDSTWLFTAHDTLEEKNTISNFIVGSKPRAQQVKTRMN